MTRSEEPGDLEGSRGRGDEPGERLFVGRDRQLDIMLRALDDAMSGRGRVVLLGGEPGIGKTRLAEEFARQAAALDAGFLKNGDDGMAKPAHAHHSSIIPLLGDRTAA